MLLCGERLGNTDIHILKQGGCEGFELDTWTGYSLPWTLYFLFTISVFFV